MRPRFCEFWVLVRTMTAEPSVQSSGATAAGSFDRPAADLRRWSAFTLIGLLWFAALLIGWRRLARPIGDPLIPLRPALLLSVGGLMAAAAAGVRLVRRYLPTQPEALWPGWIVLALTTAGT